MREVLRAGATGNSGTDLPGCVATGADRAQVERNIREAVALHLDGMREDGQPIPAPTTVATFVEV